MKSTVIQKNFKNHIQKQMQKQKMQILHKLHKITNERKKVIKQRHPKLPKYAAKMLIMIEEILPLEHQASRI